MAQPPALLEQPADILRFLRDEHAAGRGCALLVVIGLSGGSMRQVGSLAAVSETGVMAGYISNGCIDADIILHAKSVLETGKPKTLRYGAGSPFIDLQLPCGGSIDLLIDPAPDAAALVETLDRLEARKAAPVSFSKTLGLIGPGAGDADLHVTLEPGLRLVLAGRGPSLLAVAQQGLAADMDVAAASPVDEERAALAAIGASEAFALSSPSDAVDITADPWTAVVLLFHDHVWEPKILSAAAKTDAFYIGCMGSQRTHEARKLMLEAEGLAPDQIARIRGPIGVVPAMRSAHTLGSSVLAEIIAVSQDRRDSVTADHTDQALTGQTT